MSNFKKVLHTLKEANYSKERKTNDIPPESSKWHNIAKKCHIGVLDLDNIAAEAGFDNFEEMDRHTPKKIANSPVFPELVDGFKKFAGACQHMKDSDIEKMIEKG